MNPLNLLANWAGLLGAEPILQRLFLASIEAAGLALVVAALIALTRLRSPRVLCLLWLIVILKPIVSLTMGSAIPIVCLETPTSRSAAIDADGIAAAPGTTAARALPDVSVTRVVIGAWLAGVILATGWHLQSRLWVRRIIRAAQPAAGEVAARYRAIAAELGLRRVPHLSVSDALESPAIVGLATPTILIPAWLAAETDTRKLDWSMRHELTHWKWLDPLSILIRDVAVILFWFHPAVWWSGKRLVETMELACDRAMLRDPAEATDYAEQLFKILQNVRQRRRPAIAGGLFATRTQIGKRIAALLDGSFIHLPQMTWRPTAGLLLACIVVLSVGVGFAEKTKAASTQDTSMVFGGGVVGTPTQPNPSDHQPKIYGGHRTEQPGGAQSMGFAGYASSPPADNQPMGYGGYSSGQPMGFGGHSRDRTLRKNTPPNKRQLAQPVLGYGGGAASKPE